MRVHLYECPACGQQKVVFSEEIDPKIKHFCCHSSLPYVSYQMKLIKSGILVEDQGDYELKVD